MTQTGVQELTERFIQFYRNYYREEVGRLAQEYPNEQRSLYVDYNDLFTFDRDLAEDYLAKPEQMREYAEEALRLYDLPADVSLGQAHVRLRGLPSQETFELDELRVSNNVLGSLIATDIYVHGASDVEASATEVAFECQRCGTMNYIPQTGRNITEPTGCQGCEREGPFKPNTQQSEYVDQQTATVGPLPESNSESDERLDVYLEDDLAGEFSRGDRCRLVGVLKGEMDREGVLEYEMDVVAVDEADESPAGFWNDQFLGDDFEIDRGAVQEFAMRSRAVLDTQKLDESATRTKIITPFISLLGWRVYHPEVSLEYTSEALGGKDRADYVLLDENSNPAVVVEAKQEGTYLSGHEGQLKRYMRNFGAELGMLTDGESFLFFCSDPRSDVPEEVEILSCSLSDLETNLDVLELFAQEMHVTDDRDQTVVELAIEKIEQREDEEFDASEVDEDDEDNEVKRVISEIEVEYDEGAPIEEIENQLMQMGYSEEEADEGIKRLRKKGELYEPVQGHLRTT